MVCDEFGSDRELLESHIEGGCDEDASLYAFPRVAVIQILVALILYPELLHQLFCRFDTQIVKNCSVEAVAHVDANVLESSFNELGDHHTRGDTGWVEDQVGNSSIRGKRHFMRQKRFRDYTLASTARRELVALFEISDDLELDADGFNGLLVVEDHDVLDIGGFAPLVY